MKRYQKGIVLVVGLAMFQQCLVTIGFQALTGSHAIAQTQTKSKAPAVKKQATPKKQSATATLIVTSKPKGSTVSIYGSDPKGKHTPATFTGLKPGNIYLCADQDDQRNHTYVEIYFKAVKLTAGKTTYVVIDFNEPDDGPPEGDGGPGAPTPMDKLLSAIPYRAEHFTVSDAPNPARYDVMIIPHVYYPNDDSVKLTPQEYFAKNWKQCEQYGKEALRWIQSRGVSLKDLRICWLHDEWWPAGKTIKL